MQYKVMIVGAGGVGGYLTAKLAQAFSGVTLLSRGTQLAAIRERGLTLVDDGQSATVYPNCTDIPEEAGLQDAILFCTKGYGLKAAVEQVRPCVGPNTLLIPLLNGVNTHQRIRQYIDTGIVLDGCIYVFSRITSPGVIEKTGSISRVIVGVPGTLSKDAPESLHTLCALLRESGVNAELADDVIKETWIKWTFICSNGQANAYYNVCVGELREDPKMWAFLEGLLDEVLLLAEKEGIGLPKDLRERHLAAVKKLPYAGTSSLSRDLNEVDKPTELDLFAGEICRLADKHALAVPYNRSMLARFPGRL